MAIDLKTLREQLEVDMRRDMMEDLFSEDLRKLQSMAWKARRQYFPDRIAFYLRPYEPVSVTGPKCELSCKHCNKHYLRHMHWIEKKKNVTPMFEMLKDAGVKGVVLSGGSKTDGSVPTYEYSAAVKKAKKKTGLAINAHTGVIKKAQAEKLAEYVDCAMTDVIGDRETIEDILGLRYGPNEIKKTLRYLREAGIKNLAPHIIVGLNHGKIAGETKALSMLSECDPDNIVIVVFIPTKGTPMEKDKPPKVADVAKIIAIARIMYPAKNISLSCVRPGGRYRTLLDAAAVRSGVNKMAVPSKAAYNAAADKGLEIDEIKESRCCSW